MGLKFNFASKIKGLLVKGKQREAIIDELEELLISSDFGIEFSNLIIDELKNRNWKEEEGIEVLKEIIRQKMINDSESIDFENIKRVFLIFGVNGTGKTTTIGKLANKLKKHGKKVLIAAADTYRDAAIEQLAIWAKRADVPIIRQQQGSDPGAVVYDACEAALSRGVDILLVDTAGRLHNKERLMKELSKIDRVIQKKYNPENILRLITVDATTGQNAMTQAETFNNYTGVDGIILTKLDSSAKGGIACAISWKLRIPILYLGVGETIDDLIDFDVDEYLNMLFS